MTAYQTRGGGLSTFREEIVSMTPSQHFEASHRTISEVSAERVFSQEAAETRCQAFGSFLRLHSEYRYRLMFVVEKEVWSIHQLRSMVLWA